MADSRQHRNTFYLTGGILLVLLFATLCLLSWTADSTSRWKVDCTKYEIYSISSGTDEILGRLDEKVDVTYYCTEELPSFLATIVRDTRDLFEEFRRRSGGKFRYEIVNPNELMDRFADEKAGEYMAIYSQKGDKGVSEDRKKELEKELDAVEPEDALAGRRGLPAPAKQRRDQRIELARERASRGEDSEDEAYRELLFEEFRLQKETEFARDRISPRSVGDRTANSVKQLRVYSAIKIAYLERPPEVIEWHVSLESLEYELAYRILKVTMEQKPVVAVFDARKPPAPPPARPGMPPPAPQSEYSQTLRYLGDVVEVRDITLKEGDAIDDLVQQVAQQRARKAKKDVGEEIDYSEDEEIDVNPEDYKDYLNCFVVVQPHDLEDRQVYEINRVVSLGIPTVFLVSPYTTDISREGWAQGQFPITILRSGLDEMFRSWGFEVGDEMIASNTSGVLSVPQAVNIGGRRAEFWMPTTASFIVTPHGESISSESGLTNRIPVLVFPSTAGLRPLRDTLEKNKITFEELVSTGDETWTKKVDAFVPASFPGQPPSPPSLLAYQRDLLSPKDVKRDQDDFIDEPIVLAAHLRGSFEFTYEGEPVPGWKPEPEGAQMDPHQGIPGFPGGLPGGFPGGLPRDRDALPDVDDPLAQDGDGDEGKKPDVESEKATSEPVTPPKTPPAVTEGAEAPSVATPPAVTEGAEAPKKVETAHVSAQDGRVIVLGSVDMLKDSYLQYVREFPAYRMDVMFFANCVETFTLGDVLMEIRRKTVTAPEFKKDSDKSVNWILAVNLAVVPLLVAVIGILRFVVRSRSSVAYERRHLESREPAGTPEATA